MQEFQVPKREVDTRILLDDGRVLDCRVFTAVTSPEGGPESVIHRLNESSEEFLPVASGQDRFLLNKSGIVTVQITDTEEIAALTSEAGRREAVRLSLTGGISLLGQFHIAMPPQRSRVLDFLNQAPRFVPLFGPDKVILVQRGYIVSVLSEA